MEVAGTVPPPPPRGGWAASPLPRRRQATAPRVRPPAEAARGGEEGPPPSSSTLLASADALESLLAWSVPAASARALGAGLYAIVCAHALAHGVELLQPVTAAAAVCAAFLAWSTAVRPALGKVRGSALLRGRAGVVVSLLPGPLPSDAAAVAAAEALLAARVAAGVQKAASALAPAAGAAAIVAWRRLAGRNGPAPAVLLAVSLYALAAAAEARLSSNTALLGVAWVGAFAAGPLRGAAAGWVDALAEEAVRACAAAAAAAGPSGLAWAGAAAAFTWAAAETARPFTRASLAAAAAGAALAWRAHESLTSGRAAVVVVVEEED